MDTKSKIIEILNELRPDVEEFEGIELIESGVLDSFDLVSLVHELSEAFEIEIGIENIMPENFKTLDRIKSLVEELIRENRQ
jgi:D-alanine--poly(phosphoribitol) ligase subunit 2